MSMETSCPLFGQEFRAKILPIFYNWNFGPYSWPRFIGQICQVIWVKFLAIFSGQNLNQNLCLMFEAEFGPNFEPNLAAIFLSKFCTLFGSIFVGQILRKFRVRSLDAKITVTQFRARPQTFIIFEWLWQSSGLKPKPLNNLNSGQYLVWVSFLGDPSLVVSPLGTGMFVCLFVPMSVCRHLAWTQNISVSSWWNWIKLSGLS